MSPKTTPRAPRASTVQPPRWTCGGSVSTTAGSEPSSMATRKTLATSAGRTGRFDTPPNRRGAGCETARMDEFTIRAARPEDHERLGELTAAAYLDDGLLDFGAEDPYLEVLRDVDHRAEHADVLVAVGSDGTVLGGVAFVGGPGPFANIADEGEAEFRTLAVAPAGRGRGVGTALVRECIERARALGRHRLVLSTQTAMKSAHRIYERFGFTRAPERDWSPVGDLELLVYVLDLDRD